MIQRSKATGQGGGISGGFNGAVVLSKTTVHTFYGIGVNQLHILLIDLDHLTFFANRAYHGLNLSKTPLSKSVFLRDQ